MKKTFLCSFLTFLIFISFAFSENISEKIRLNGFLSQGYIYTTFNDFIPNSSDKGSFEMSEFGVTFSADLTDKLRLGFQLLGRDFGPIGNYSIQLDWGFADYRFSNLLGIRLGKIKTPIGLYNETRDMDALHPMEILPQSIYDESMRPVFTAYNGFGLYGNMNIGFLGSLDYHGFVGTVNHPEDAPYIQQIYTAINTGLLDMGLSISPFRMDTDLFTGIRLIWNTPLDGLRFGANYTYLSGIFNTFLLHPIEGYIPITGKMELDKSLFFSGEFSLGNLTITSEYMEMPVNIYLNLFDQEMLLSDEIMQGWYVMVSYIFGDKLTVSALYDQFYGDKRYKDGESALKMGYPAYFAWQKDIALGLRYDINFNWTIKLECHSIDGLAKSYIFTNLFDTEQKWNMIVIKSSFNF
jgi:hypothetical protein